MTGHRAQARGLRVVGASAGTGKTYRLTQEIEHAVTTDGDGAVRADQLVAVTYTRRAQVELESRIRQKLLSSSGAVYCSRKKSSRPSRSSRNFTRTQRGQFLAWVNTQRAAHRGHR